MRSFHAPKHSAFEKNLQMLSYQSSILRRTLPQATFNRLRLALGQMAQRVGEGVLLLTEDVVQGMEFPSTMLAERFTVLVSQKFSALLLGTALESQPLGCPHPQQKCYQVGLSFDPDEIATFVSQLGNLLKNSQIATETLGQVGDILQPNDASLQGEFTLSLLEILASDTSFEPTLQTDYPYVSVCQPVHDALRQQVEQEGVLNQVTTQIRQTLELPAILETVLEQVRSFLQADRLVIYQFQHSEVRTQNNNDESIIPCEGWGRVTYEARASDAIVSVLHSGEDKRCFVDVPNRREKYRQCFTLAVENVESTYVFSECMLEFMRRIQVRAKLVVPIVVQDQLWGLLIAHQCSEPRQWQESEKTFLRHIAEHLAIAIHQAELYTQVQQQKQTLEQRVSDRTAELHDALLAAQSANRAKSEFLATMSHELRTPLTCIIGLSSTLLRWSFGQLTQRQRDYLQTIHDNGEHLLGLINDILDLSQVEAGKTVLNITEFSLSQLATQTMQSLREKAIERGVYLGINLRIPASKDRFRADPKRVKQILLNLLSNGIKFTPTDGKVILRVWLEGNTAVFQVEDTGIGIAEEQRPLLFQKFQQLNTSYNREYEGVGLGLALTKQLIELHGGRIDVESTVSVGSIFTVWLPCQPITAMGGGTPLPAADIPPGRIALIANHEESATLICDILTAAGHQVVWLMEGYAAVKQIEIFQPQIVIVDIQLYGMNGYEVMRLLRHSKATRGIKILALIPQETAETLLNIVADGADDYLTKPVIPEQLLEAIATLMIADVPAACAIK